MHEERIELSARDRERLKVLHKVEQGHLRAIDAVESKRDTVLAGGRLSDGGQKVGHACSYHLIRLVIPTWREKPGHFHELRIVACILN